MRIRAERGSRENRSWREAQLPSTTGAEQATWHLHADAAQPRRAPRGERSMPSLHPASQQVEGEHLKQECRLVCGEGIGGGFADAEASLELADDRLDARAVIVATPELVGVVRPVVGGVDVHREVQVL